MKFRCVFELHNTRHIAEADTMKSFTFGFWVTKKYRFCVSYALSSAKYWVPPHAIVYLEKVYAKRTPTPKLPQT